jgi:hypothetical protein
MWNRENLAFILLGIYLILDGLLRLAGGSATGVILGLLAVSAGVLLLLQYIPVKRKR